jgi:DNA-binding MarR family transcriptional regulator
MTTIGREGAAERPGLRTAGSKPSADRSGLTDEIIAQFRTFFRELRCMGSDRMRRGGMSMAHFHILSMLDRHGEMAMSRVADVLDVSLSNASGLIDRLEERGLVERIRVPDDRRIVLVRVTDVGRRTLAEAEVVKEEMVGRIIGALDTDQLRRVAQAINDITGAAQVVLSEDPTWREHSLLHGHGRSHAHEPQTDEPA